MGCGFSTRINEHELMLVTNSFQHHGGACSWSWTCTRLEVNKSDPYRIWKTENNKSRIYCDWVAATKVVVTPVMQEITNVKEIFTSCLVYKHVLKSWWQLFLRKIWLKHIKYIYCTVKTFTRIQTIFLHVTGNSVQTSLAISQKQIENIKKKYCFFVDHKTKCSIYQKQEVAR